MPLHLLAWVFPCHSYLSRVVSQVGMRRFIAVARGLSILQYEATDCPRYVLAQKIPDPHLMKVLPAKIPRLFKLEAFDTVKRFPVGIGDRHQQARS